MDTQQMMELLLDMKTSLARLDENAKTSQQGMLAMNEKMETYQAKLDANREDSKTHREESKAWREDMKATLATKEDRQEMIQEMRADREQRKADMEEILAKMEERMTATQAKTDVKLKELTEPREEMMQSAEEHQEVPREDAVVIPVRGRKRRHRGQKQAAGRHGEPKEFNRGVCGSRKKLAAACRKASRRATVALRKRNVFRKSWTHRNCGLRKEVTASRKKVAQRSPTGGAFEIDVGEARNAVREERTQPQSTSEGGARDSCHPWKEEDQPTRSSR
jgi:chromosome segregation ATPase